MNRIARIGSRGIVVGALAALIIAGWGGIRAAEPQGRRIHFRVTHPMKVVNGRCEDVQFSAEPAFVAAGANVSLKTPVRVTVPILSIRTGDSNRDSHIAEALKYPTFGTIVISIEQARCEGNNCWIDGALEVAGISRPLHLTATREGGAADLHIYGNSTVRMTDHGVKPPSLLFVAAEDLVAIDFDFHFAK